MAGGRRLVACSLLAVLCNTSGGRAQQLDGLLDFLNLRPRPRPRPTIGDFTNQGLGLINYFKSVRRNPIERSKPLSTVDNSLLGIDALGPGVPDTDLLPNIQFLKGVPVVPGVVGSFPGAGECLPAGVPLVQNSSPSMIQNFLRKIPGAGDILRSLSPVPNIKPKALMGKWYWVLVNSNEHSKYCATSEFKELAAAGDATTFTIVDSFKEGSVYGAPKLGFGYGLVNGKRVSIYTQSDPCPYQVVSVGQVEPKSGQYDYIIMSNYAKYPVVALVRDLRQYAIQGRYNIERDLRQLGYVNFLTEAMGSHKYLRWSECRRDSQPGQIVGNIVNRILFG